jgi:beta-glucosidase
VRFISRRASGLALLLVAGSSVAAVVQDRPAYRNASLTPDARARDLLGRMTLQEKFWQLYMSPGSLDDSTHDYSHGAFGLQIRTSEERRAKSEEEAHALVREHTEKINSIQRYFVERTRLGIPIIPFEEALHGLASPGATVFPQAIALAATWDTLLAGDVFRAAAQETRERGIRQALSPGCAT